MFGFLRIKSIPGNSGFRRRNDPHGALRASLLTAALLASLGCQSAAYTLSSQGKFPEAQQAVSEGKGTQADIQRGRQDYALRSMNHDDYEAWRKSQFSDVRMQDWGYQESSDFYSNRAGYTTQAPPPPPQGPL